MSRVRTAMLLAAAIATVSLSACVSQGSPQQSGESTASESARPKLLTWTQTGSSNPVTDALVAGTVTVNDAGCVIVGSAILLAPPGSAVLADGSGVSLAGQGDYRFGDSVQNLRGGYRDISATASDPDGVSACRSKANPEKEYAIVWGG